jgi:hypothetical protein
LWRFTQWRPSQKARSHHSTPEDNPIREQIPENVKQIGHGGCASNGTPVNRRLSSNTQVDICLPIFFKKSQEAVRTAEFPDLIESHAIRSSLLSPTSSQVQ